MKAQRFSNPLFVALDTPDLVRAREIAAAVAPHAGGLKIGLEFYTALGPKGVEAVVEFGLPVFADLKFHDIPNTVAGSSRELARLGVSIFNIHVAGGEAMMRAACEAAHAIDANVTVIGVTVLTSLDDADLGAIGQLTPAAAQVERLARLAKASGLAGVVCSPREIGLVRQACGREFLIVTPGVRPPDAALADQRRVMTPGEAAAAGADILVVGRPITEARDPGAAARSIVHGLGLAIAL